MCRSVIGTAAGARRWVAATLLALVVGCLSCSDSMTPGEPRPQGGAGGRVDPAAPGFVLESLEVPLPGQKAARVDLVGSNLAIDAEAGTVLLDVALRNASDRPLYAPAEVSVGPLDPPTVQVENGDLPPVCPVDGPEPCRMGFDYSASLGAEGVLGPGSTSAAKTWVFKNVDLVPFSFGVTVYFAHAASAAITGSVFADSNRNGRRDAGEGPFRGRIEASGPGRTSTWHGVGLDGSYRVSIERPGLYALRWHDSIACRCPWWVPECCAVCVTTPNPLQVVIVPGPDGGPQDFAGADFGVDDGPCDGTVPAVILTDTFPLPDAVPRDPYTLLEARLEGDVFTLRVGFGGCTADHPFTLFAGRSFMESFPVQTWMLLGHDDRDEPCDAWFERTLLFHLDPIRQAHILDYGGPGIVRLRFRDAQGDTHSFDFGP